MHPNAADIQIHSVKCKPFVRKLEPPEITTKKWEKKTLI